MIRLEKLCLRNDVNALYKMMNAPDQHLFSSYITFNSQELFENWLRTRITHEFHDFYTIRIADIDQPIGFAYNYDFSLKDGHCKLCIDLDASHRFLGLGAIAAIRYIKILFELYPLRKIYLTIYDYNQQSLQSNFHAGFREEGILSDFRYFDGSYHSLHYLSMTREKFLETLQKYDLREW